MSKVFLIILVSFISIRSGAQTDAALDLISELSAGLQQSTFYRSVAPDTFTAQLRKRIKEPYDLHQGRTLFCWAAIPIAFLYDKYPVSMVNAAFSLYRYGYLDLQIPSAHLKLGTSRACRSAVGSRSFSGRRNKLRGRVLDQMVFLAFAENYSCWLNADPHFSPGDQVNPLWASATLSKEAKVWQDLGLQSECYGSDLPWRQPGKIVMIQAELENGKIVALYLNALTLYDWWFKIGKLRLPPPIPLFATHYVRATKLEETANGYTISFWDRNGYQSREVSSACLYRSIFGYVAVDTSLRSCDERLTAN